MGLLGPLGRMRPSGPRSPIAHPMPDRTYKYLDPAALGRLKNLSLDARRVVEGFFAGHHRSPLKGFSIEFAEHREYTPGVDPRHRDWRVLGKPAGGLAQAGADPPGGLAAPAVGRRGRSAEPPRPLDPPYEKLREARRELTSITHDPRTGMSARATTALLLSLVVFGPVRGEPTPPSTFDVKLDR